MNCHKKSFAGENTLSSSLKNSLHVFAAFLSVNWTNQILSPLIILMLGVLCYKVLHWSVKIFGVVEQLPICHFHYLHNLDSLLKHSRSEMCWANLGQLLLLHDVLLKFLIPDFISF